MSTGVVRYAKVKHLKTFLESCTSLGFGYICRQIVWSAMLELKEQPPTPGTATMEVSKMVDKIVHSVNTGKSPEYPWNSFVREDIDNQFVATIYFNQTLFSVNSARVFENKIEEDTTFSLLNEEYFVEDYLVSQTEKRKRIETKMILVDLYKDIGDMHFEINYGGFRLRHAYEEYMKEIMNSVWQRS